MNQAARQRIFPGAISRDVEHQLEQARKHGLISQILKKNPAAFRGLEPPAYKIIGNRLGWIDVIRRMAPELPRINELVRQLQHDGIRHLFVLGMGGSSLAPEVFGAIFGRKSWLKSFTVVDTTAPSRLEAILKATDITKSFFIVSSKSGSTIETVSQYRFFFKRVKEARPLKAGNYFAAITDEGSELHRMARRNRFRETFLNPADIGGRYSALSFFGLVPAAFTRANLEDMIRSAEKYLDGLAAQPDDNDALQLGVLLGTASLQGYDILSFIASPRSAPFVPWIEQLVAESTGKSGKGIIPVDGENPEAWPAHAAGRVFVSYAFSGERQAIPLSTAAAGAKSPRVVIDLVDPHDIGAEMLKWEMATAVAATVLGINPFDEPNVSESKKNTTAIIGEGRSRRKVIPVPPLCSYDGFDILAAHNVGKINPASPTAVDIMHQFLQGMQRGDYLALLCYAEMTPATQELLASLRWALQEKTGLATLRGFGPRYLHSIGQLYKGGPAKGHFWVMQRDYPTDFEIPKMSLRFGQLIRAQAMGDVRAMLKRERPVLTISLRSHPAAGLRHLLKLVRDEL